MKGEQMTADDAALVRDEFEVWMTKRFPNWRTWRKDIYSEPGTGLPDSFRQCWEAAAEFERGRVSVPLPSQEVADMARGLASKPFSEWKAHECRTMVGYVLHADGARLAVHSSDEL